MTSKDAEILLIYPPFGAITNPYISIPVLAAYLRNRNIPVAAYDMRQEFYIKLLTPQNILRGLNYAKERFLELNTKSSLNFSEAFEYWMLSTILSESQIFKREIERLSYPFADFSDIQNSKAILFFIRTATVQHFPNIIISDFVFPICSAYSPYSSADILQASEHGSWYTKIFEEIIRDQIVRVNAPHIIGFSVVFASQIIPAFQCARIIKHHLPHVHITMGGPYISACFRELEEKRLFTLVDSFVLDEGEIPLETLVKEFSTEKPDLSKIPGLIYLADDEIRFSPSAPTLDIEQSPSPDFSVFQLDNYLSSRKRLMLPVRLSKGCSWQKCTFCRTDLSMCRDYQQASKEFAYHQLVHTAKTFGASFFFFSDENADPSVLEYISERLLEDQINIKWHAHTRVSKQLTKERCELYRKAGCISLGMGLESFSDRILKLMKKGITSKLIEEVLEGMNGVLPITAYMMVGFPTETEEEARAGYEKINDFMSKGLLASYYYSNFRILYGSDIWKHPNKYSISNIYVPEGNDLFPEITDFHNPSMSREKAYQLGIIFNKRYDPLNKETYGDEVRINDTVVPLRYDVQKIVDVLTENGFTVLPFTTWLHNTDVTIFPSV